MFCIWKIIFATVLFIFIIQIGSHSLASTLKESAEEDLQFYILRGCLIAAGVNSESIHHRNSGINYDELNWQWNTLNGYVKPLAYLVPTKVSDIQKAVVCCRLSKVRIVARGGGHSYVKNGFGDSRSLIVDLMKLNQISLDPMRMRCEIGAGARLGQIAYVLWKNGNFLIPSGTCATVGISGLTLGGGFGRFGTVFGLASDNVIEMEMVDANGQLLVINNATQSDLFWALRGGGGGNFGIVTKFQFKMYSAPTSIVYVFYEYSFRKDFSSFYRSWQSFITSGIPRHIVPYIVMKGDAIKIGLSTFNFQHQNETVNSVTGFLKSFSFPNETDFSTKVLSYAELLLLDGQQYASAMLTNISQLENLRKDGAVGWKKVKSFFVDKILNENQIYKLKELLADYLQHTELHVEPGGGAINSLSRSDTAFMHRGNNFFQIQLKVFTAQNEPPNLKANRAMKMFYERSKSIFSHHESYQNYLDQDIDDYLQRYYGANLKRLIQIKRQIDPDNVFHHPQSIPVDF